MQREKFGSRLGFILISAGCAIGLGNVWRFPYITGKYGGAAFVLIYLVFLVLLGLPIMVMEFAVGRASQASVAMSFDRLEPLGTKWHWYKWFGMAGNYLLMMFYTTIGGWLLLYFVKMAAGNFKGLDASGIKNEFGELMQQPGIMIVCMIIVVAACFAICSIGLQKGVEKITKVMMLMLLALMIILAVRSVTLSGAGEGLAFYLVPDFAKVKEAGLMEVVFAAMGQSFFTLSLGMGGMAIFGSYIDKKHALLGESINVALLDTFVAVVSGLIIFPACFTYNVEAGAGPKLIFVTLPNVFNHMQGGRLWGALFFVFMSFAALSTVLAVFENILACCRDLFGWSRKKAALIVGVIMIALGTLSCLGYGPLAGVQILKMQFLDFFDFLTNSVMMPIAALATCLLIVRVVGFEKMDKEIELSSAFKRKKLYHFFLKYLAPLCILVILISSIANVFGWISM